VFFEGISRIGAQVCIPSIVIDEIVNKYCEELKKIKAKLCKASKDWDRLTGTSLRPLISEKEINKEGNTYRDYILKRLKTIKAKILPYPETKHEVLVRRAIKRRKPFKEKGSGYQDALIWESILSLFGDDDSEIYLITKNYRDFGEEPEAHKDLLQDLDGLNVKHENLIVLNTLESLNQSHIIPKLERLEEMIRQFSTDEVPKFSLRKWIKNELWELLDEDGCSYDFFDVDEKDATCEIVEVEDVKFLNVKDVRILPFGDLVLAANAGISFTASLTATWDAYRFCHNVTQWFDYDNAPTELDSGSVYQTFEIDVDFSMILEKGTYKVLSAQLE